MADGVEYQETVPPIIKATRFTAFLQMTQDELDEIRAANGWMIPPSVVQDSIKWLEQHLETNPTVISGRDWVRGIVTEVQQQAEQDDRTLYQQLQELFAKLNFRWCDHGTTVEVEPFGLDSDQTIVRYVSRTHKLRAGEQCTGWPPQPAPRTVDEVAMIHYATGAYTGAHLKIAPDVVKRHEPKPYPDPIEVLRAIPLVVDESLLEGAWLLVETSTGVTLHEGRDGGH